MLSVLNSDTKYTHTQNKETGSDGSLSSVTQLLSCVQLFVTYGLQNARPSCPLLTPGAFSNSYLLSK